MKAPCWNEGVITVIEGTCRSEATVPLLLGSSSSPACPRPTARKISSVDAAVFSQLKWVNFGGGHLMTRADYDRDHLIKVLRGFKTRYPHLEVIMEPGSAIAWETGYLLTRVLDIIENHGVKTAILDVSFTAHMPDTLEMPYRPAVRGATDPAAGKPTYRLGGVSCLAGDYMSEYSFSQDLKIGDRLILEDMIHYTMVKTTMFNGVKHPDIVLAKADGEMAVLRRFGYEDFRARLG